MIDATAGVWKDLRTLLSAGAVGGASDGELLRRFAASGDEVVFAALVERHETMVARVCRAVLGDRHDAQDACQATFLVLARRAGSIRRAESVGAWLHGVARRVSLRLRADAARRRARERRVAERSPEAIDAPEPRAFWAELHEEIDRLPAIYRAPIVLCGLEGRTHEEAARQLGWPVGTVKIRLARGRSRLGARLARRGLAPGASALALGLDASVARAAVATSLGEVPAPVVALAESISRSLRMSEFRSIALWVVCGLALAVGIAAPPIVGAPPRGPTPPPPPTPMPRPEPAGDPAPAPGTLSGRVVDPDGKPVAGARVALQRIAQTDLAGAITDADGRFRIGPIPPVYRYREAYGLVVDAPGLARGFLPAEFFAVYPGADRDLGTVRLDRGRVFTGQVLDADGTPKAGAKVRCHLQRFEMGHTLNSMGGPIDLATDAQGRYRTPPLPVCQLGVTVEAPGRRLAGAWKSVAPGGEEALGPIRLEPDVPIHGVLKDRKGRPVAGAEVCDKGFEPGAVTDAEGRFTLPGYGPRPQFQMQIKKDGYGMVNWSVSGTEKGFQIYDVTFQKSLGLRPTLAVEIEAAATIEGTAVDDETGAPVRLENVILCMFDRKSDGEVVLSGCRGSNFQQPEPGHFRVEYSYPTEYHLTLVAEGYREAEAFTPKVDKLEDIRGIVVRMKRRTGAAGSEIHPVVTGRVTRDGVPVKTGWVALWQMRGLYDVVNAPVLRGRTVGPDPVAWARAPIRDGAFSVDAPMQGAGWYAVAEEPGKAPTQVGPFSLRRDERKTVDIACVPGGTIRGRVEGVAEAWRGHVWVVAFSKTQVRAEAPVAADGTFTLADLPAGEYGLKVGHDAYDDPEVPRATSKLSSVDWKALPTAEPWKHAKVVKVESGREAAGVVLEAPR